MLRLQNKTPFVADLAPARDERGAEVLLVAVKGTFTLDEAPQLAAEQEALELAYAYGGEPGRSSLYAVPELDMPSGGTDVVLTGEAWAPHGRPVTRLDTCLSVAGRAHGVRVEGDRVWRNYALGWASAPVPFVRMPLVYERAFGGSVVDARGHASCAPTNPVGVGFRGSLTRRAMRGTPLPNLSLTRAQTDATPAGFGWIAPHWRPRSAYAGTYDATWTATRAPYLPLDFDRRFRRAGPAALYFERPLQGGEPVVLQCLTRRAWLPLQLPTYRLRLRVRGRTGSADAPAGPSLEAVCFAPARGTFTLLWRAAIPCALGAAALEAVQVSLA